MFYAVLAEVVYIAELANKYILSKYNCTGKFVFVAVVVHTGYIKKTVIELCSALARSLYNLQKLFFHRRKDQAFSFRLSSFL